MALSQMLTCPSVGHVSEQFLILHIVLILASEKYRDTSYRSQNSIEVLTTEMYRILWFDRFVVVVANFLIALTPSF